MPNAQQQHQPWIDTILQGDSRVLLPQFPKNSVDLSFWSPPYRVGKSYEQGLTFGQLSRAARRCTTAAEELCTTGTMRKD